MLKPYQVPECTTFKHACTLTFFYILNQISFVCCTYYIYIYEKPFVIVIFSIYSIVGIYVLGFSLDNSPLLGVSGIFTTYMMCCFLIQALFLWSIFYVCLFSIVISAFIKDQYSHYIFPQKPIFVNIWVYFLLNIFPYAIPFHICHQNIYYKNNIIGFQML